MKRRALWIGAVLAALAVTLALAVFSRPKPTPSFLRNAVRIADLGSPTADYSWFSPEVVSIRTFLRENGRGRLEISRLDTMSGQRTRGTSRDFDTRVSPDGRWRLQFEPDAVVATPTRGGAQPLRWPNPSGSGSISLFWLTDSSGWIEVDAARPGPIQAKIHRLNDPPTRFEAIRIPRPPGRDPFRNDIEQSYVGATPRNALVSFALSPNNVNHPVSISYQFNFPMQGNVGLGGNVVVVETDLTRSNAATPVRRPLIAVPNNQRAEIALSPTGDRLVWMNQSDEAMQRPGFLAWLMRFLPSAPRPVRQSRSLWVTDIDGRNQRLIGAEPFTDAPLEPIHLLRWTPDGKAVTFIHKNTLWKVPVTTP